MIIYSRSNPPPGFYVYAYLRSKDSAHGKAGEPYYIGKGKEGRAWEKGRNEVKPPVDKNLVVIMESGLLEIGSFSLERFYIRWYGRIDNGTGILRNKTDGGEGATGIVVSDETRTAISKANKGKKKPPRTKEHIMKIAEKNRGKKHTDETKQKMSIQRKGVKLGPCPNISKGKKGKKFTEEHIMALRKAAQKRGPRNPHSEETKKKISERAKSREKLTCPVCGKTMPSSQYNLYGHGENCKGKMND